MELNRWSWSKMNNNDENNVNNFNLIKIKIILLSNM